MPTIFLVDDHPIVRQGVRTALAADPQFIILGEASDGLEAVRQVERLKPDVLILDLIMPGLNGLDALRIIRNRSPQTRVIVFSMHQLEAFVAEAIQLGAAGYVLKGGPVNDVVAAIQRALAGEVYLSPALSIVGVEQYLARTTAAGPDRHALLSPRERQVFQLAAEGKTAAEIGQRLSISERTVERHRTNFMHKLGLRNQTELVLYAVSRGILTSADRT